MADYEGRKGPLPPVYFLASLFLEFGLHYRLPVAVVVPEPWNFAGVALILLGVSIVIQPALAFRKSATSIKPFKESSSLVQSGMYRITRNPMYLGMVTVLTGTAVLLGNLSPFLMPVLFALIIRHRFIRVEEAMLEKTFGDEYREFKQQVRRWI